MFRTNEFSNVKEMTNADYATYKLTTSASLNLLFTTFLYFINYHFCLGCAYTHRCIPVLNWPYEKYDC